MLEGLISHSDAGSQFTSVRYGERLDELGALPSIGSVGDAFDNALAEAMNSAYKEELIRGPGQGPWKNVDDVELATLSWVHWWNTERLHEYLDYVPPAEFEENWSKANAVRRRVSLRDAQTTKVIGQDPEIWPSAASFESNTTSLHQSQDGSVSRVSGASPPLTIQFRRGVGGPSKAKPDWRIRPLELGR